MQAQAFDPPVHASCLAQPECLSSLLEMLDRYCAEHLVDSQCQHDLHLILEEACFNIISYAYPAGAPGPLSVQVQGKLSSGRPMIELTIEDSGTPFDPLEIPLPRRTAAIEDIPLGGWGVLLIRRLSDQQHYTYDPQRGNVLTIGKFLTRTVGD